MNKTTLRLGAIASLTALAALSAHAQSTAQEQANAAFPAANPEHIIGNFEAIFGAHHGQRRNHTKGFCATGEFMGQPKAAAALSRSALFSGEAVPVIARFSIPGGNPKVPDTAKAPRGMALQFQLPGGGLHHMTMVNTPVFSFPTPEVFAAEQATKVPAPATGKPDPAKLQAFLAAFKGGNPQGAYIAAHNPPPSYANAAYFGIHTFHFINAADEARSVRWRFVPADGEKSLSDEELKTLPADFLQERMIERAKQGPILWDMVVSLGEKGDTETDPTVAWPAERQEVTVGQLRLTAAMPQAGAACEGITYIPLIMADGIAPSADPVLNFRNLPYGLSHAKRSAEQAESQAESQAENSAAKE